MLNVFTKKVILLSRHLTFQMKDLFHASVCTFIRHRGNRPLFSSSFVSNHLCFGFVQSSFLRVIPMVRHIPRRGTGVSSSSRHGNRCRCFFDRPMPLFSRSYFATIPCWQYLSSFATKNRRRHVFRRFHKNFIDITRAQSNHNQSL